MKRALLALAAVSGLAFTVGPAPLGPSEARYDGPDAAWLRAADCGACHTDEHAQWEQSAHAHSSLDNPWYRSAFEDLRAEVGERASRHCGGCHDPVLLATGALERPLDDTHPFASEGVTCLVCHGIVETGTAGNGDYRVDLRDLPDPVDSIRKHAEAMRPAPLEDGTLCRGCHRGFLTPETGNRSVLMGFDDWGEWEASGWAGVPAPRMEPGHPDPVTCIDCHFADGHGAPGGRTALVAQTGGLDASLAMLGKALDVRIPVAWVDGRRVPLDGTFAPAEGSEVVLDVTIRNVGAGHSFPGGTADTQDVWLRVRVGHAKGALVAGEDSADGVHFRSLPLDADGRPVRTHTTREMAVGGFDRTIPPGEVALIRVAFEAPGGALVPRAEVVHRAHRPELAAAACAATTDATLDGCAPLPEHVIATGALQAPDSAGLYAHALGMSRGLQEEIGAGLDSLDGLDTPAVHVLRARILGRQGRADAALAALEGLDPQHPAVWRARGDALAQVWRWEAAAEAYTRLAELQPRDPASFRKLTRARGSSGDAAGALEAARAGLVLQPRDPDLLHSKALALQDLRDSDASAALDHWFSHRVPDDAHALRIACDAIDAECATERVPIPTIRAH